MWKFKLAGWGLALVMLTGLFIWRQTMRQTTAEASYSEQVVDPEFSFAPFTLTGIDGKPVSSESLKGKVWIASFFFSSCPGPCLELNRRISELQKEFTDPRVKFVSITVDPETDTPAHLADYGRRLGADPNRWIFLTGDTQAIQDLSVKSFRVAMGAKSDDPTAGHQITHSSHLIVVDAEGKIRGYFSALENVRVNLLKRKVNQLLEKTS